MKYESAPARPPRPTLVFAGTVLATLATFRALDVVINRLAQLPASAYAEMVFLDNLLVRWWHLWSRRVPWWLTVGGIVLVTVVALVDSQRFRPHGPRRLDTLFASWTELEGGAALRWFVVAVTAVPTWALSCYARNLYVDQTHVVDRLLVVALWATIAWRPLFVIPFSITAGAVGGQFLVPLGFISWTEMSIVLRFPVLVGAFWIVRTVTRERRSDVFIFAWCCVLAATYWTSGLGKLRVDWLTHPHVHLLLMGAYANGWLAFLDARAIERVAKVVAVAAWPFMLTTLVIECGALVLLWRRWSLVAFLLLATTFHLGAFALTGIFFWKWIAVDACLLVYLFRDRQLLRLDIFTPARFALSVAVILASRLWAPSENLTWFDTPLTYSLRFEAEDARGDVHVLPAGFFRPYTEVFVLGTVPGISPHPQLTRGMGVTMDRQLAATLEAARSPEAVFALEATRGPVRVDSAATASFDDFVRRYAANARCAADREPILLRVVGVPRHLWTFPLDASVPCDVPLSKVRVFEHTSFFDGTSVRLVRRRLVREIAVTPPPLPSVRRDRFTAGGRSGPRSYRLLTIAPPGLPSIKGGHVAMSVAAARVGVEPRSHSEVSVVLAPLVRAVAHAASISVLGATVALAQHPPFAQAHAPSGDQATLLGTWAGSFVMEAKGGMELLVARDSTGAGWRVRMQLMVDHPFPPVDVRDFKVDGKTVTWLSDLMGTTCKAKAALDGNTMKGDMVCDARTLTFDLTKKA